MALSLLNAYKHNKSYINCFICIKVYKTNGLFRKLLHLFVNQEYLDFCLEIGKYKSNIAAKSGKFKFKKLSQMTLIKKRPSLLKIFL